RESVAGLLERHDGVRAHSSRFVPRLLEYQRQRHRETARVRGGDELLGIRTGSALETRREAVRLILQDAALERNRASSVLQSAAPRGRTAALDLHVSCSCRWAAIPLLSARATRSAMRVSAIVRGRQAAPVLLEEDHQQRD